MSNILNNLPAGLVFSSGEGNISWFHKRQSKLVELISSKKPVSLIETGFNMGHSANLICQTISQLKKSDPEYAKTKINFYIFDTLDPAQVVVDPIDENAPTWGK